MTEKDKLPLLSNYRLQWCLKELDKEEFQIFKKFLKEKYSVLTTCSLPWTEVDDASVEHLVPLLHEYCDGPLLWAISINILEEMKLLVLSEKAREEMEKCSPFRTLEDSKPIKTDQGPSKEKVPEASQAVEQGAAADTYQKGGQWDYRAHVITRFLTEFSVHHSFERTTTDWPEMQVLADAFNPDPKGVRTRTVVLHGKSGVGKSALARRVMLFWAQGKLYRDVFSYVIFLYTREMKWTEQCSFAKLIAREWPNPGVAMEEIMSQPERLLFIIDGLDDLHAVLRHDDWRVCGDWAEKQPVSILVFSLLKKVLLPESFLLITARDTSVEKLKSIILLPRYLLVGGMSMDRRTRLLLQYDTDPVYKAKVLRLAIDNQQLLDECEVSAVCSLVLEGLGLQEEPGRHSVLLCPTLTGLLATVVFHQLSPRDLFWRCLNWEERAALKGLCQMAAEGVWNMRSVFYSDSLRLHGLKESELSALFRRDVLFPKERGEPCYSFLHLRLQEFCAALYYLLEGLETHCNYFLFMDSVRNVTEFTQSGFNAHLPWVRSFLFGLMNRDVVRELEVLLGSPLRLQVKQTLLHWVSLAARPIGSAAPGNTLEAFRCLFETQDEEFTCLALKGFQEVWLPINQIMDLKVSFFCLQHCQNLQKIQVDVKDIFSREEHAQQCPMLPQGMQRRTPASECWENFCSVLGTHPSLQQLDLGASILDEWAMKTLCIKMSQPACKIQNLILKRAEVASGLRYLWRTLTTNGNLKHLHLGGTPLKEEDVKIVGEALKHPNCSLETLRLDSCGLTPTCYLMISQILNIRTKLKSLSLARNKVTDQGMNPLCDALKKSWSTLKKLILDNCDITAVGCQVLASTLNSNQSLTHLCLSNNDLGAHGMSLLCRPIRLLNCALQRLILNQCNLDVASCGFLAFALMNNRQLTHLSLSMNPLEDNGVKLLCEAMKEPSCHLQDLELVDCRLTATCCKNLACLIKTSKYLRSLDLAANALGDSGVVALCEGLKEEDSILSRLGLEACRLTSDCCEALSSALSCNQHLTSLNLLRNNFSPRAVKKLCSAFRNPTSSLQIIGLWKTQYPDRVIKQLEEAQLAKPHLVIDDDWYSFDDDDRYWWRG